MNAAERKQMAAEHKAILASRPHDADPETIRRWAIQQRADLLAYARKYGSPSSRDRKAHMELMFRYEYLSERWPAFLLQRAIDEGEDPGRHLFQYMEPGESVLLSQQYPGSGAHRAALALAKKRGWAFTMYQEDDGHSVPELRIIRTR